MLVFGKKKTKQSDTGKNDGIRNEYSDLSDNDLRKVYKDNKKNSQVIKKLKAEAKRRGRKQGDNKFNLK